MPQLRSIRTLPRCVVFALLGLVLPGFLAGCRSPDVHREQADQVAYGNVREAQQKALGRTETFSVERPADTLRRRLLIDQHLQQADESTQGSREVERIPQWPDAEYGADEGVPFMPDAGTPGAQVQFTLLEALQVAARGSREYQTRKEDVFEAALALDLERRAFRNTWTGTMDALFGTTGAEDGRVSGVEGGFNLGFERALKTGGSFAVDLGLDLVKLLTQDKASAFGALADATLSMPLLRGSGRFVVTEPLTQAERDVVYAVYGFERYKRNFAVQVASDYLGVLQSLDEIGNTMDNYERLVLSTRRARRLADAGELEEIQVDQARQDELRSRNRWIVAQLSYERQLDAFKVLLGLPADCLMELDRTELQQLTERADPLIQQAKQIAEAVAAQDVSADAPVELLPPSRDDGGPLEIDESVAIHTAFLERLDLRTQIGRVYDAQRKVAVAADQLRADANLLGRAGAGESRAMGSAGSGDGDFSISRGNASLLLDLDLPFDRTAERNLYRSSLVGFEQAVRGVQDLEDQVKLDIRNDLRGLLGSRESVAIQATSVEVAKRRLQSTTMFLEAGRAAIRDVLEAEESLLSAQNGLTAALVQYRVGELELQRDMGVLEVNEQGLWTEYVPVTEEEMAP